MQRHHATDLSILYADTIHGIPLEAIYKYMLRFSLDEKVNGSPRLTIPGQTLIILLNKTQINLINPGPLLSVPAKYNLETGRWHQTITTSHFLRWQ